MNCMCVRVCVCHSDQSKGRSEMVVCAKENQTNHIYYVLGKCREKVCVIHSLRYRATQLRHLAGRSRATPCAFVCVCVCAVVERDYIY